MNVENNPLSFLKTGTILVVPKTEGNTKVSNQGISSSGSMEQGMGVFQNLLLKSLQSGMETKDNAGHATGSQEAVAENSDETANEIGINEFIQVSMAQMPIHRMEMESVTTPAAAKVGTDSLTIETGVPATDSLTIETGVPTTENLVTVKPVPEGPESILAAEEGPGPELVEKDLNLKKTATELLPEAAIDAREGKPEISGREKPETAMKPSERPEPTQFLWKSMEKEDRVSFLKETAGNGIETAMLRNEKPLNPEEMGINPTMKVAQGNEISEMNMPDAKVEKPAVYNQIAKEIESTIKKEGPMEFTVKLNPKELGGVDIRIKMVEGKLSIDIMAERQDTHNLLSSQVDKLTNRLGMQNFQVETIQLNPATATTNPNVSSQGFPMNFAMDFSNKRHQEKMKDKAGTKIDALSTADINISEIQATQRNGLEKMKFDSHRINYSV